jgi:O-antigen/teichoic acid export membrane protein
MIGLLRNNLNAWRERFRNDESFRHLVRASFFSLLIRVVGLGTGFLVTVITSRFYGADALGIVSICIAILSFASVIGKLGMDVALMRYIAELHAQKNYAAIKHVYLKSFRFIIPVCIFITLILYFFSSYIATDFFHKPYLEGLLKVNALFVLPLVILLVNSESIRGLHRIRAYTFLQTSAVSILATIFLIAAIPFTIEKFVPVSVQFISITLAAFISMFLYARFSGWNKHTGTGIIDSRKLIRTSSPMFITTLMQLIMTWGGTLIMASYYPESEVGVYNAIVRISTFTNISILAINSIASPRIAAAFGSGRLEEVKKLSHEAAQLIFISSVVVFLPLFLFPHLVLTVFGKDFTGNEFSLKLLLAGQLFVAFAGLASQVLNMADREKNLRNNALIAAAFNLTACFILIPARGIMGACIAQVIGMVVWNVLCIYSVKKKFGFFTFYRFGNKR